MTQETKDLQAKIDARRTLNDGSASTKTSGFGFSMAMMMDLVCSLLVGLGLGVIIQQYWHTSVFVVVIFTLLGGTAGLVSVVKTGLKRSKS